MHQGKKGNLILPLWFDSSNCSNDSSVVLWVLWMSPEPVILPVGTRGWGRMLLWPTKWPLNHRLWSHSGRWKSARLLLDVSGVWMRVYLVHPWQMCIVACVQGSGNCLDKNCIDARRRCRGEGCAICVAIYNPVKRKLYVYKHVKQTCVMHKC